MKRLLFLMSCIPFLVGVFNLSTQNSGPVCGEYSSRFACTSFAVYAERTIYGMNFDYPDVEIRFTLNIHEGRKIFQMEFQQGLNFLPTAGMNSQGFFASLQMLFPEAEYTEDSGVNDVYPWQLYEESLFCYRTVAEVNAYLSNKRVIQGSVTLHNLFADTSGDAMIVESGEGENDITRIKNNFIVMTNFPIGMFRGKSFEEVEGSGAARYKTAYQHILDHLEAFDVKRAWEVLEKTALKEDFSTQCSMVFDPEKQEVFIALRRDFERIWKVSIKDGTIETYSGFKEVLKKGLDTLGIKASDLKK